MLFRAIIPKLHSKACDYLYEFAPKALALPTHFEVFGGESACSGINSYCIIKK